MTKYKSVIRGLRIHYICNIAILSVLFLLTVLKTVLTTTTGVALSTTVEMYAIAITLIAIPAALYFFAEKFKKLPAEKNEEDRIRIYRRIYLTRLYIISIVALGNILLYALSGYNNFLWLIIILFITFMFCRPSESELLSIKDTEE